MIRTRDILVPNQALYQTELRPDNEINYIKLFSNCKSKNTFFFLFNFIKIYTMINMQRILGFLLCFCALQIGNGFAASSSDYISKSEYERMYPYMNTQMRTSLASDENTNSARQGANSVYTRTNSATSASAGSRRVVSRSASSSSAARSATSSGVARSGTSSRTSTASPYSSTKRVVPRSGTSSRSTRTDGSYTADLSSNTYTGNTINISAARCLSDYTTCMNEYCEREDTEYNRCYCSPKLAQIDSEYQETIQDLVMEIIDLQYDGDYTDTEMAEYWQDKIVQYTGTNSWVALDSALDIDWLATQSRVQGQETFLVGHEYCSQHLDGCYYMAANMRDAYISDISRDCASYESGLDAVKTVAESVIEAYSED